MMNNLISFFLFLLLSIHVLTTDARQSDTLTNLMKLKKKKMMMGTTGISELHESRIMSPLKVLISQMGSKEADKIGKLPGQPGAVDFAQYGGYLTVDHKAGRALFYYFVEAVGSNHSSKPLLLWLNGGPGCSSFGYGAMEELGPFRVKSDGKTLFRNPFAWNNEANVLFLESPAGVGFSYSNTTSDYGLSSDSRTAKDAYVFLVNWLERFPEYKRREFYIAGESYAGHYVPQLAHAIIQQNELANNTIINLKGIAIGNALINDLTDELGMYDFFWSHALMSDENIDRIHKNCDFSSTNSTSKPCYEVSDYDLGSLDIYNIYAPLCFSSSLTTPPKKPSVMNYDPCSDYYVSAYLNRPEVQEALHANVTKLDHRWSGCSIVIPEWGDSPDTVLPILEELMAKGLRVWVYSGDVDGRLPVTSTRYSLNKLKLPVKTPWQAWYVNQEVGGYSAVYKGDLTLATVRGAGHEVPSYQPIRALAMIKFFLAGKPLPS
ncbi:hypothetical protein MRB53_031259 [Persea americana]|uniref:Uncharacterized protein n=1 Tax=Persea americana TaxID=3435 RepID=A0ACC2KP16_PERAE|nr:hypothetical protein MRB53_031259 [Persea americana]